MLTPNDARKERFCFLCISENKGIFVVVSGRSANSGESDFKVAAILCKPLSFSLPSPNALSTSGRQCPMGSSI